MGSDDGRCEASDAELVEALRAGDDAALNELWRHHHAAACRMAVHWVGSADAEDLVQEAFFAMHRAVQRGGGPSIGVRAYLYTIARNLALRSQHRHAPLAHSIPLDELTEFLGSDPFERHAEHAVIFDAFRELPPRWQEVLWYCEVEGLAAAETARLMGITANAASQLAFRAREGLRQGWIDAHIERLGAREECAWVLGRLAAHARGRSPRKEGTRIDAHLADCADCARALREARHVGRALAPILLLGFLGTSLAGMLRFEDSPRADAAARFRSAEFGRTGARAAARAGAGLRPAALAAVAGVTALLVTGALLQFGAPLPEDAAVGEERVQTLDLVDAVAAIRADAASTPEAPTGDAPGGASAPSSEAGIPGDGTARGGQYGLPTATDRISNETRVHPTPQLPAAQAAAGGTAEPSAALSQTSPAPASTASPPVSLSVPPVAAPPAPEWVPERSTRTGSVPLAKYAITLSGAAGWQVRVVIGGVEVALGVIGADGETVQPLVFVPTKPAQLEDALVTFEHVSGSAGIGSALQLRLSALVPTP